MRHRQAGDLGRLLARIGDRPVFAAQGSAREPARIRLEESG
jgi:hypothetical protein